MKSVSLLCLFFILNIKSDCFGANLLGSYFYKELGCAEDNTVEIVKYKCPDFFPKNGNCLFKKNILKAGEKVDHEELKGSCHADCRCGTDGRLICAQYDCFERLKSGCSHFKYSLDSCCPVDSVCGPIAECEIGGKTYQEGNTVFTEEKCEVCICDVGFEMKSPFCRPRKCYDQATFPDMIEKKAAPAFFKDENCCPNIWVTDEGQRMEKINNITSSKDGSSCNFGDRKVLLGYGFKTKVTPYGREVSLVCECTMPPFLICKELIE